MDKNFSKLCEIVKDRAAWHASFMGSQRVGNSLVRMQAWMSSPQKFARAHGVSVQLEASDTHILILEGFLLYSYK